MFSNVALRLIDFGCPGAFSGKCPLVDNFDPIWKKVDLGLPDGFCTIELNDESCTKEQLIEKIQTIQTTCSNCCKQAKKTDNPDFGVYAHLKGFVPQYRFTPGDSSLPIMYHNQNCYAVCSAVGRRAYFDPRWLAEVVGNYR